MGVDRRHKHRELRFLRSPNAGRIWLALAIAVVGVIVAWRALSRSVPSTPQSQTPLSAPGEFRRPDAYEIKPDLDDPAFLDDLRLKATSVVRSTSPELALQAGVTAEQLERLATAVADRIALTVSASSLDEVAALAMAQGAESMQDPGISDTGRARWERWPELWHGASLSFDKAFARFSNSAQWFKAPREWQTAIMRNIYGPVYPEMPEDAVLAEIVVPALTHRLGSRRLDVPVDLGFAYRWDPLLQRWIGVNVTMYAENGAEVDVLPPP